MNIQGQDFYLMWQCRKQKEEEIVCLLSSPQQILDLFFLPHFLSRGAESKYENKDTSL